MNKYEIISMNVSSVKRAEQYGLACKVNPNTKELLVVNPDTEKELTFTTKNDLLIVKPTDTKKINLFTEIVTASDSRRFELETSSYYWIEQQGISAIWVLEQLYELFEISEESAEQLLDEFKDFCLETKNKGRNIEQIFEEFMMLKQNPEDYEFLFKNSEEDEKDEEDDDN